MKIGELKTKGTKTIVEFGETENGYVYKDYGAFYNKTDDICYIPELGLGIGSEVHEITKDSSTYTYSQLLEMCKKYVDRNNLDKTAEELVVELFEAIDWQHPGTQLDFWEMFN